jgi:hypothetical protein
MKSLYTPVALIVFFALLLSHTSSFAQIQPYVGSKTIAKSKPAAPISLPKATPIWSEDFGTGIGAWTVNTISGPVDWKHTTVGHQGTYPTAAIQSTTWNNGWIIVDSDGDNFSGGGYEESELTYNSAINLSGYANIQLQFQQMFREWQADITTVQISGNGGGAWTDYVLNTGVGQSGTANPDLVVIDISSVAGNQTDVRVRFKWEGQWDYGWQIDDVQIVEMLPSNITLDEARYDTLIEYSSYPLSQTEPLTYKAYFSNTGVNAQTAVSLGVSVNDGGGVVYTGVGGPLASLAPGTSDSLTAGTFHTPASVNTYTATFSVYGAANDNDSTDNEVAIVYAVSDSVYARDRGALAVPYDNDDVSYEVGNMYEVVSTDIATSITAGIHSSTNVGAYMYAVIYELDIASGSQVWLDQTPDHLVTAGDLGTMVTLPFSNSIALNAGTAYYAMIGTYGGSDTLVISRVGTSPPQTSYVLDGNDNTWYYLSTTPVVRLNMNSVFATSISLTNPIICNANCSGSLSVNASGGSFNYTYQWSDSGGSIPGATASTLSGLCAGTYLCYIDDGSGNTSTETFTITEPAALSIAAPAIVDVNCGGQCDGSISLSGVAGGVLPYQYSIDGGATYQGGAMFTNLCAGTYNVSVQDANGCVSVTTATVTEPTIVTVTITAVDPSCLGACDGSLQANVTGGTGNYTYNWIDNSTSNSIGTNSIANGVCQGIYTLTVTDGNGCTSSAATTLVALSTVNMSICMITVSNTAMHNVVVWERPSTSQVVSVNVYREIAGTYTLVGNVLWGDSTKFVDTGAGVSPSTTSYRYKIASLDACGNEGTMSDYHETIHLTANTGLGGEVNLIWDNYEGFVFTKYYIYRDNTGTGSWVVLDSVSSSSTTYTDLTPPSVPNLGYRIEVVPPSPCDVTRALITRSISNFNYSIGDAVAEHALQDVELFPNPNTGNFSLTNLTAGTQVELLNALGQTVFSETVSSPQTASYSMSQLAQGMYHIRLLQNGATRTIKMVVR